MPKDAKHNGNNLETYSIKQEVIGDADHFHKTPVLYVLTRLSSEDLNFTS